MYNDWKNILWDILGWYYSMTSHTLSLNQTVVTHIHSQHHLQFTSIPCGQRGKRKKKTSAICLESISTSRLCMEFDFSELGEAAATTNNKDVGMVTPSNRPQTSKVSSLCFTASTAHIHHPQVVFNCLRLCTACVTPTWQEYSTMPGSSAVRDWALTGPSAPQLTELLAN